MEQYILSVAGRDFFIDQDCHWQVSVRAARRWADAHGQHAVRLSRRTCAGPGLAWGPAHTVAEIPVSELAQGPRSLRQRVGREQGGMR